MSDPAIAQDIIEAELIEEYHWLPQDIAKIPYKTLQKLFIVQRQKAGAKETKINVEKFKAQHKSSGRGQAKRFVREV